MPGLCQISIRQQRRTTLTFLRMQVKDAAYVLHCKCGVNASTWKLLDLHVVLPPAGVHDAPAH